MKTRPGSGSNVGNVGSVTNSGNSGNAGIVPGNTSPALVACNRSRRRPMPSTPTPQASTLDCQTPPPSDRVLYLKFIFNQVSFRLIIHYYSSKQEIAHGKFAGISPESIQCMSEQISIEHLTEEACSILAEDVSYKLRQLINVKF